MLEERRVYRWVVEAETLERERESEWGVRERESAASLSNLVRKEKLNEQHREWDRRLFGKVTIVGILSVVWN